MNKVEWLILVAALVLTGGCLTEKDYITVDFSDTTQTPKPTVASSSTKTLRVAVAAMISPKETFVYYKEVVTYLGEAVGIDIQMLQRKTYKEINELFSKDNIELAFICSGPYALEKEKYHFQAIATPVIRGSPFYQSYLIVNKKSGIKKLADLQQRTFAFSDPDSNTGSLVPTYWLHLEGTNPETFFRKTHFTYSHDNSILTVAKSLVDGAAVDGHKWEYFQERNDVYTSKTRIIKKSEEYGSPPIVASSKLPQTLKSKIQGILLSMHQTEQGKQILDSLLIDRFTKPEEAWYEPIKKMKQDLSKKGP